MLLKYDPRVWLEKKEKKKGRAGVTPDLKRVPTLDDATTIVLLLRRDPRITGNMAATRCPRETPLSDPSERVSVHLTREYSARIREMELTLLK